MDMFRKILAQQKFEFQKTNPLSEAAIVKVVHQLANSAMNKKLKATHKNLYKVMLFVNTTIFIKTIILIKGFDCYNLINITATPIEEAQPWRFFIASNKYGGSMPKIPFAKPTISEFR